MRTLVVLTIALGFVLTASVCQAKIGDTLDQCIAHYGQPKSIQDVAPTEASAGSSHAWFIKDGLHFHVTIFNGTVGEEIIYKIDRTDMTDAEIQTLLDSEAGGPRWDKSDKQSVHNINYIRADGNVSACYYSHQLQLNTKAYFDAKMAKIAEMRKAKP